MNEERAKIIEKALEDPTPRTIFLANSMEPFVRKSMFMTESTFAVARVPQRETDMEYPSHLMILEKQKVCPVCQAQGKKSRVPIPGQSTTLAAKGEDGGEFWDEHGDFHIHDENRITLHYKCSNGHWWNETLTRPCPCDGCGKRFGDGQMTQTITRG